MPIFIGKSVETNEEVEVELEYTVSIGEAKREICNKLGVNFRRYDLLYKDEILLDQETLKDVDFFGDPDPVLVIAKKTTPPKPLGILSMISLGPYASRPLEDSDDDEDTVYRHPKPYSKFTETGALEDPRKFSIAENSSLAFRIYMSVNRDYNSKDREKVMDSVTKDMQRIVDTLTYDELEVLATECLKIKQEKMENLRDEYYKQFEKQPEQT